MAELEELEIGKAIQDAAPFLADGDDAVLTGYVLVAEWMSPDGVKWLSWTSADAAGEKLSGWLKNGMLHEALHGTWPTEDLDEE